MNWTPLSSSWLSAMRYDPDTQTLQIRFKDGVVAGFGSCPQSLADELESASSPGQYFHQNIKGILTET